MQNKLIISAILFLFIASKSYANLIVIYDSKKTIDAIQFYPFKYPSPQELQEQINKLKIINESNNPATIKTDL